MGPTKTPNWSHGAEAQLGWVQIQEAHELPVKEIDAASRWSPCSRTRRRKKWAEAMGNGGMKSQVAQHGGERQKEMN
jgi:hypothetical protein